MNKQKIIKETEKFVKEKLKEASSGHGWQHTHRVWQMAKKIAREEKADLVIVEISALLHDVWDWKFYDEKKASKEISDYLEKLDIDSIQKNAISFIVKNLSFKGAGVKNKISTLEGKIVQDSDRLDALGAIGIARVFSYGASANRTIYDPKIKPIRHNSFQEYKSSRSTSINHFHEKLLLLKDLMHTQTAKKLATGRHNFLKLYLKEFLEEWDGRK